MASMAARASARSRRRRGPDASLDASIVGAFGATGTGKSAYIKRTLDERSAAGSSGPLARLIFDPKHEYGGLAIYTDERAFHGAVNERHFWPVLVFRPA